MSSALLIFLRFIGFSKETSFQEIVPKFKIFFNFSDVEGIKGSHTRPSIAQICKEIFIIVLNNLDSFHSKNILAELGWKKMNHHC